MIDTSTLVGVAKTERGELPAFTHRGGDPRRRAILEFNHRVREGLGPQPRNFGPNGGWGRTQLNIPEFDFPFIRAMFPELGSRDGRIRHQAWQRFARSPLSEPYRLDRHVRHGAR